jgi:DNA-binding NarL/FixJ family response regulator
MSLRIVIVDDFSRVREDLRTALTLVGGIEVVGQAANGREAVDLAARLAPDAVVMDVEMPVLDGCEAARAIKAHCPACRVVALTVHGDEATRRRAFRAGFDEFVVKGAALKTLVRAISGE